MAYLVTGGTGFIGSRVIRDLVKEGEKVVAYDLFPSMTLLELLLTREERERVTVVRGDVTSLTDILHAVQDNCVERIIHLAYLTTPGTRANPPLAIRIACDGTVNIFETARLLKLAKVVWASSSAVFGPPEKYPQDYIPNDAPHFPFGIYGASKSFNETVAAYYCEEYGLDIVGLRYGIVYGTGMERTLTADIIHELMENPAFGKPGKVPFGDDTLNWLYVDDAARVTVLASRVVKPRTKAFNVNGDVRTVKEAAGIVRKLFPAADITLLPGRIGVSYKFDASRLEEELGFHIRFPLEYGIKDIANITRREHGLPPV